MPETLNVYNLSEDDLRPLLRGECITETAGNGATVTLHAYRCEHDPDTGSREATAAIAAAKLREV
ncbi:hypothetical protein ABN028_19585 [Actinopolymorpha sp. B17G11]|uniref:hypothetical protein n=1 Tax=Actinopolymorpha sp. B17G11 TaxID=3160861 RepID=UPI0032E3B8BC